MIRQTFSSVLYIFLSLSYLMNMVVLTFSGLLAFLTIILIPIIAITSIFGFASEIEWKMVTIIWTFFITSLLIHTAFGKREL